MNSQHPLFRSAIIGKLYSNTLLVSFNNRIALREIAEQSRGNFTGQTSGNLLPMAYGTRQSMRPGTFSDSMKMNTFNGGGDGDVIAIGIKVCRHWHQNMLAHLTDCDRRCRPTLLSSNAPRGKETIQ
jgi:hypothetical protein